ncbi:MAG: polyprenyl synthetase family protein [Bacteroidales bacterium]|nr:polyprenyl synthetase family protein [Bacteroidales bacterium]
MERNEVITWLGADWDRYQSAARAALGTDVPLLQEVNDNVLAHSGKMLRPMLALLCARACPPGAANEDSIRFATALELLHNATLLHDDVADRSEERRGVPTVASLIGPSPAVLVGDFWLARAVHLVVRTHHFEWAVGAFSKTLTDLAEGEMLQQQKAGSCDTTQADYERIIFCKTASLFRLCCQAGARSVDAPGAVEKALAAYGEAVGMAFQIRDDIFDYEGGAIGKPVGQDLMERKITAPLLEALKGSAREREIRSLICTLPEHPEHLAQIQAFVVERGGLAGARAQLDRHIARALEALEAVPASEAREFLTQAARYIGDRNT